MWQKKLLIPMALGALLLGYLVATSHAQAREFPSSPASREAKKLRPAIEKEMREKGLEPGAPVFVRIFKKTTPAVQEKAEDLPREKGRFFYDSSGVEVWDRDSKGRSRKYNVEMGTLELYVQTPSGEYKLFKSYPIRNYSGLLGPKRAQGDAQAVEGFYSVRPQAMNPYSSYLLSFDLSYPNAFDRAHGRTGSLLMVHGKQASEGCYAMGDPQISEIYTILEQAFENGQKQVDVHAFPFPLTPENLARFPASHPEKTFWERELRPGYEFFEQTSLPPTVRVSGKHYQVFEPEFPDFQELLRSLDSKSESLLEDSKRLSNTGLPGPEAPLIPNSGSAAGAVTGTQAR